MGTDIGALQQQNAGEEVLVRKYEELRPGALDPPGDALAPDRFGRSALVDRRLREHQPSRFQRMPGESGSALARASTLALSAHARGDVIGPLESGQGYVVLTSIRL